MFDEFPDKVRIWEMIDKVYAKASYMENMYRPVLEEDEGLNTGGHCVSCRGADSWLKNLISALMVNELHYRRYRYSDAAAPLSLRHGAESPRTFAKNPHRPCLTKKNGI